MQSFTTVAESKGARPKAGPLFPGRGLDAKQEKANATNQSTYVHVAF